MNELSPELEKERALLISNINDILKKDIRVLVFFADIPGEDKSVIGLFANSNEIINALITIMEDLPEEQAAILEYFKNQK